MPIKFRCTGCKSKLYVPARWHGTSIVCPRCETRVMVPAEAGGGAVTTFEGSEVERVVADLAPTPEPPAPAEEAFEMAPFTIKVAGRGGRRRRKTRPPAVGRMRRSSLTVPIWTPYACGGVIVLIAVGAFLLGAWWATRGGGS